jgi:hypothetical protein
VQKAKTLDLISNLVMRGWPSSSLDIHKWRKWNFKIKYNLSISEICWLHSLTWPTWNTFLANHSFTIHHGRKKLFHHDKAHQWGYLISWRPSKIEEDKNELWDYVKEVLFKK